MSLARTLAVTLTGLEGHLVDVEAHSSSGLPGFTLVGLPDAAVRAKRWSPAMRFASHAHRICVAGHEGISISGLVSSSTLTSLKVTTWTDFTKRLER